MKILALDSSGKLAGVCIMQDGIVLYEKTLSDGFTHSETLLPLISEALQCVSLTPADINLFAGAAGPGSFTGLRIGLATLKGLALPFSTKAAAVSTLQALAEAAEFEGTILPALDARRGEVYYAAFSKENGNVVRLLPDDAAPVADLLPFVENCKKPLLFIGDGASLCYNQTKTILGVTIACTPPIALGVAKCATAMATAGTLMAPSELRPAYHRLSQAERELAEKNQKECIL